MTADNYTAIPAYLNNLINLSSLNTKIHISIYDTSGLLSNNSIFYLPDKHRIHNAIFCRTVKSTSKGLKFCMKCKEHSFSKAPYRDFTFQCRCYLGITDFIRPVFINNKLACIIYLGNLILDTQKNDLIKRIEKYSTILQIPKDTLLSKLDTLECIRESNMELYLNAVETIKDSILFAQKQSSLGTKIYSKNKNYIVESVISHANEYYALDLNLDQLAKLHFVNPNHLRNLFKKYMGTNFTNYLNQLRIEKSTELLCQDSKSIMDISQAVGFNNVTYFNKLFKEYIGCSPKQYINKQRISSQ